MDFRIADTFTDVIVHTPNVPWGGGQLCFARLEQGLRC